MKNLIIILVLFLSGGTVLAQGYGADIHCSMTDSYHPRYYASHGVNYFYCDFICRRINTTQVVTSVPLGRYYYQNDPQAAAKAAVIYGATEILRGIILEKTGADKYGYYKPWRRSAYDYKSPDYYRGYYRSQFRFQKGFHR